jgi:hypothetical protein
VIVDALENQQQSTYERAVPNKTAPIRSWAMLAAD